MDRCGRHVVSGNGAASDVENLQDKVVGAHVQEDGGAGRVKAMSARGGVKVKLDAVSAQPGGLQLRVKGISVSAFDVDHAVDESPRMGPLEDPGRGGRNRALQA